MKESRDYAIVAVVIVSVVILSAVMWLLAAKWLLEHIPEVTQ